MLMLSAALAVCAPLFAAGPGDSAKPLKLSGAPSLEQIAIEWPSYLSVPEAVPGPGESLLQTASGEMPGFLSVAKDAAPRAMTQLKQTQLPADGVREMPRQDLKTAADRVWEKAPDDAGKAPEPPFFEVSGIGGAEIPRVPEFSGSAQDWALLHAAPVRGQGPVVSLADWRQANRPQLAHPRSVAIDADVALEHARRAGLSGDLISILLDWLHDPRDPVNGEVGFWYHFVTAGGPDDPGNYFVNARTGQVLRLLTQRPKVL